MDKASVVLEILMASSPQLPIGYQHLSATADHPPIDKEIDSHSSFFQDPLSKPSYAKPVPNQPLVRKSVDSGFPPVYHPVLKEHNSHVVLVSSDSPKFRNDSSIPAVPESPASIPLEQGGNHTIPQPSSSVVSFD